MAKPMDLKSTLNLPKTDFPMKAKLPEREPEQLAAWEARAILPDSGIARGCAAFRAARWAALSHGRNPSRHRPEQNSEGHDREVEDHGWLSLALHSRLGLPRPAHRDESRKGAWAARRAKFPPRNFAACAASSRRAYVEKHKAEFKRLGVFGQWDKPYLTMDPRDEASIAGAFIDFFEKGYVYRGLKPVYWCIYRPHRAGRSRSGIRRPHQPFHLGEVSGGCAAKNRKQLGLGWRTSAR